MACLTCNDDAVGGHSEFKSGCEAALHDAIEQHAISVQYQPQFDLQTGAGCGVEALARWVQSSGQMVTPAAFIPVAEETGMIHSLGAWVLECACTEALTWCGAASAPGRLSVNVSPLQIDASFVDVVRGILARTGFPVHRLELEITESAFLGSAQETISYLRRWKNLGVRISLDDFGVGYSCLSYLCRLPLDRLKLDKSMIDRIPSDKKSVAVVRSIISPADALGLDVIAEGVETQSQLSVLADLGCNQAQGYLFARPMPAKAAQVALNKSWGNRAMFMPGLPSINTSTGEWHAA